MVRRTYVLSGLLGESEHTRQGHHGLVNAGHSQSLQDNFVKLGIRATRQEFIKLAQEANVHVLRLGCLAVGVLCSAAVVSTLGTSSTSEVNTHVVFVNFCS